MMNLVHSPLIPKTPTFDFRGTNNHFFVDKYISYAYNSHMKEIPHKKSDSFFAYTDAIRAYLTIQTTHDAIHRYVSIKLARWSLSPTKYGVIMQLFDRESIPLSKIGDLIFRCNSNMTTLIDRMERDGLVKKSNSERDRRVKEIRLTERGKKLAAKVIGEYRKFLHQMMSKSLSADEQRTLIDLLNRVRAGIE
jgi:MarR family 2-MHQ and catechol resistance regulon transcriptional repressor